jgi:sugar phosphate isomerase/epimerase
MQIFRDLGLGATDLTAVFAALKESGFEGWAAVNNKQTDRSAAGYSAPDTR